MGSQECLLELGAGKTAWIGRKFGDAMWSACKGVREEAEARTGGLLHSWHERKRLDFKERREK